MDKLISEDQAFRAMFFFLEEYWERGKSEEIAILLGSLALQEDGKSADPAYQKDWEMAVNKATSVTGPTSVWSEAEHDRRN